MYPRKGLSAAQALSLSVPSLDALNVQFRCLTSIPVMPSLEGDR
jgi:hypothetical protein